MALGRTQSETAYRELQRRILTFEIPARERVGEEAWARKLGLSRGAIREGLTRLLGEGLVSAGARGGYFVRELTVHETVEIRELREILETAAFALACDRVTSTQLREIKETCADFSHMVKKGYYTGACEADLKFHDLLVSASGNSHLIQAYQRSHIPLFHKKLEQVAQLHDLVKTEKEHQKILDALCERKKDLGIKFLKEHFNRGEKIMLDVRC